MQDDKEQQQLREPLNPQGGDEENQLVTEPPTPQNERQIQAPPAAGNPFQGYRPPFFDQTQQTLTNSFRSAANFFGSCSPERLIATGVISLGTIATMIGPVIAFTPNNMPEKGLTAGALSCFGLMLTCCGLCMCPAPHNDGEPIRNYFRRIQ